MSITEPELIHADEHKLIVCKPAGMLAHATVDPRRKNVQTFLRKRYNCPSGFVAHRLDKDTSGLLVFVRQREYAEAVQRFMQSSKKVYLMEFQGTPSTESCDWFDHIRADRKGVRIVRSGGKQALTNFYPLTSHLGLAVLRTGRRHQIRIQAAQRGHPIVGDSLYSSATPPLHLHALALLHPQKNILASLPDWVSSQDAMEIHGMLNQL